MGDIISFSYRSQIPGLVVLSCTSNWQVGFKDQDVRLKLDLRYGGLGNPLDEDRLLIPVSADITHLMEEVKFPKTIWNYARNRMTDTYPCGANFFMPIGARGGSQSLYVLKQEIVLRTFTEYGGKGLVSALISCF